MFKKIPYKHIKSGKTYKVLSLSVTNKTSTDDGKNMVLYEKDGDLFTREFEEFNTKFNPI